MAENTFQHQLAELQQQFSALLQLSHADPMRVRDALPAVLSGLQRSLGELKTLAAGLPQNEVPRSSESVGSNGSVTKDVRRPVATNPAALPKGPPQEVGLYEERLRSLMTDLLLAEEHERRRLAIDLHDGLSQTIALTRIKLSALRQSMDGKLKKALDEIEELVDQTNRSARSIGSELSPMVLHDLGLGPAMQWLVENIQTRYGIEIVLEDDGKPKPADEKTRIILFRAIRELLINAAKHAGARRVHVRLGCEEHHLNASVEDDGIGMQSDVTTVKGTGLLSIHERLRHVGGSMRIESTPGRGTKVRLRAPLTNASPTKVW